MDLLFRRLLAEQQQAFQVQKSPNLENRRAKVKFRSCKDGRNPEADGIATAFGSGLKSKLESVVKSSRVPCGRLTTRDTVANNAVTVNTEDLILKRMTNNL